MITKKLLSEEEFVEGHEGFDKDANLAILHAIDLNSDGTILYYKLNLFRTFVNTKAKKYFCRSKKGLVSESEYLHFVEDPSAGFCFSKKTKSTRYVHKYVNVLENYFRFNFFDI